MNRDIAIIGMGLRLPEAVTIEQFYKNLREGRDSVKEMPAKMISERTINPYKEYTAMGFLDDIDKFDHQFFNISISEAQHMDPVQRMLMEVAYETIENSGYNPDCFDNTRTVIYMSHADYNYGHFLMHRIQHEPTMFTGNNHFAAAGRIARFFNFRGNATVVNNGCSSALNAIHLACNELIHGEADYALAAGVRVTIVCAEKNPDVFDVGIEAFDGKTRAFSDDSNGSGEGEMVGCILLKPLDKALADNDHVYAVIKSTVANQSGQLSSSLTATNGAAQAEMIREAWKRGNIDPTTVTQIEAHGSGTKLGDPIEIAGIDLAFKGLTDKKHFIAVSSVKTNIGHADTGAGMAGVLKAALSVKHRELFPSLNFNKPNPFIDFKNSVTYVNTELKKWEPECGVLRVGVNSLGFTGNNVHVILENPLEREIPAETADKPYLCTFSGKTPDALQRNLNAFKKFLESENDAQLRDISYTLTVGRKHYEHRYSIIAENKKELYVAIEEALDAKAKSQVNEPFKRLVFVFSDNQDTSTRLAEALSSRYPVFEGHYIKCMGLGAGAENAYLRRFAFQYALYHLLVNCGINSKQLVGLGTGKLVVSVITGKSTLEEAITAALTLQAEEQADLPKRVSVLIERETEKENVLFVEAGSAASISQTLRNINSPYKDLYEVLAINPEAKNPVLQLLKDIHQLQYSINWKQYAELHSGFRLPLPAYQFEKTRCWITEPEEAEAQYRLYAQGTTTSPEQEGVQHEEPISIPVESFPAEWTETEKKVAHIWSSILKVTELKLTDDFFALGGHSLFLIKVNNRVEQEFGFKFGLKEMFAFATIRTLAQAIEMMVKDGAKYRETAIQPIEPREYYPLSFAQKRLWILSQFDESSVAYNLPEAYIFEGNLNKRAFSKAFDTLIARHEILRTVFVSREGEPVQKILAPEQLGFAFQEIDLSNHPDSEGEAKRLAEQESVTPFNLEKGPLLRVKIIRLKPDKHVIVFNIHHIVGDGWSSTVLIGEILALYEAYTTGQPNPLMPLRIQYKDYAAWQEQKLDSEELNSHKNYWLTSFSGNLPVLELPADQIRPAVQTFNGDMFHFQVEKAVADQIVSLNRASGTTLFMALLGALNTLFYKYSGQTDIIVGSPTAGRDHTDLENQIGFYINTLALRTKFQPSTTFTDLLKQIRDVTIGAYEHQAYPLDRLVEELNLERDMSRSALFDVIMILHNMGVETATATKELGGIKVSHLASDHKVSQRDLTFNFTETSDGIAANVEYNTDVFSKQWIENFIGHFKEIIKQVTEKPGNTLEQYQIELDQVLAQKKKAEDKKEISTPVHHNAEKTGFVAPRNETEQKVVETIEGVLGRTGVSVTDNFFEIGGHSLKAMRLIYKLNREMNAEIGLATIYSNPTIEKLAKAIADNKKTGTTTVQEKAIAPEKTGNTATTGIKAIEPQEYYDVSYAQLNYLTANQLVEDNVSGRLPLENLDESAFMQTWQALIDRHESFRTVYHNVNGTWKQKILPSNDPVFRLEIVDLRNDADRDKTAYAIAEEVIHRPFDFTNGPLIMGKLLRLSDTGYQLAFTISHSIADGWTLNIIRRDLDALYEAFLNNRPHALKPLPIQVKEYAAWHNELLGREEAIQHKTYWHNKLKGKLPRLVLPVDYPDGYGEVGKYRIYRTVLDTAFHKQLNELASGSGASLFALMLAALNTFMYKLTGQDDIIITTPVATREHEELNDVVGFFVNSLLIRSQLNTNMPFSEFMRNTSHDFVEAMSHQAWPIEKIFSELNFGVNDYTPLLLNTHNYPGQELTELDSTETRYENSDLRARVHLGLVFDEYSNGLEINWIYRVNLFKPETIVQICNGFIRVLQKAVKEPETALEKFSTVVEESVKTV